MSRPEPQSLDLASAVSRAPTVVAAVAAAVSVYAMRRADPDMFGYLTYGRHFLEVGRITDQDVFAYTSTALPWVTFEYGAHILLWLAYQAGGAVGLIGLKALLGGACTYWVYVGVRNATTRASVWLPLFLFTTAAVSRFFMFRPQLFTFAFFALYVAVLHRHLRSGRGALWVLPLVMLVWANTHGGFLAGLGALGLALMLRVCENVTSARTDVRQVLRGTSRLWCTALVCLIVTFLSPRGTGLWTYVLEEVTHSTNRELIAEWGPTTFGGDTWAATTLTVASALLLWFGWVVQRHSPRQLRPGPACWVLSCVPIIVMSYVSVRHVPIAMIWIAPVLALLVTTAMAVKSPTNAPWHVFIWLSVAAACVPAVVVAMQPLPVIESGGNVLGSRHPCRAVEFLRRNQLKGNIYNPLWWGAFLTWELYPNVLVAMDGRNISLFTDEMVRENLLFYSAPAWTASLDTPLKYPSDYLLVPADAPVLVRLEGDRRWEILYRDSDAVLFGRAESVGSGGADPASRNRSRFEPPTACSPFLK